MVDIHFMDDTTLSIVSIILDIAGQNYSAPYDSASQPGTAADRNDDDLLQYQVPGGTSLKGYAEPSQSESMGTAINTLLTTVAPMMSAFGLILPILGVILGILEVICALLNPFSVKRAVKKLLKKWVPAFISLFPPLAGVVIALSTIKLILSVVFFILTVVIPSISLLVDNIKTLARVIGDPNNATKAEKDAVRAQMLSLLLELANQLGILAVMKPLLEIIFLILRIGGKLPCKKKKKKKRGGGIPAIYQGARPLNNRLDFSNVADTDNDDDPDTTCCDDDVCPPAFKDPPKGTGILTPTYYGSDSLPFIAWKITPLNGHDRIDDIQPYVQSFREQLNAQLDEGINEALPAGAQGDAAYFRVKVSGRRGIGTTFTLPILKINSRGSGGAMYVMDSRLVSLFGTVNYEIVPNWDMLVARNIVGLGCDPEIFDLNEALAERYPDIESTAGEQFPDLATLRDDFAELQNKVNNGMNAIRNAAMDIIFDKDVASVPLVDGLGLDLDGLFFDDVIPTPADTVIRPGETVVTPIDISIFPRLADISGLPDPGGTPASPGIPPGIPPRNAVPLDTAAQAELADLLGIADPTMANLNLSPQELIPLTEPKDLPYDDNIAAIESVRDNLANTLVDFSNNLKSTMNSVLSKITDRITSTFEVDRHIVRAGGGHRAIIYVTPRDVTGTPLLKNLPSGVDISVDLFTTFGTISNQEVNKDTGVVTADLTSPFPGDAILTARVNTELITEFDGDTQRTRELKVKFVSDAVLPKRRLVSKPNPDSKIQSTQGTAEREPGGN